MQIFTSTKKIFTQKSIKYFLIILLITFSSLLRAQGYYKFSDKLGGDYSDGNRFSINLYAGAGIPIAYTFSGEIEYCIFDGNFSFGVNGIFQKYTKNTFFDFQGGKNTMGHLYGKYTLYPSNGRFSTHLALGAGIPFNEDFYLSYLIQLGMKYRFTRNIGLGAVLYYSIEPCVAAGLSITL